MQTHPSLDSIPLWEACLQFNR